MNNYNYLMRSLMFVPAHNQKLLVLLEETLMCCSLILKTLFLFATNNKHETI